MKKDTFVFHLYLFTSHCSGTLDPKSLSHKAGQRTAGKHRPNAPTQRQETQHCKVCVCLFTAVGHLFTVSLFTHTNTVVVFATSGQITTGPVDCEVSPQQIIFPALAEVHSHPRRRVYTLHELYRLQTIISHFSCGPVHWDKLRLSAQAFGERIHPVYLILYLSTYILIIFQSWGALLSLWKQQYNLWLCWGFVKSEKISPDDGRVILVQAWKIQAFI